jgi:hypothetical protein
VPSLWALHLHSIAARLTVCPLSQSPRIFHSFIFVIHFLLYVRPLADEQLRKKNLRGLYHIPIPKQTDFADQLQHRTESEGLTIRFNPETRQRSLDALQWGLIPYWAKTQRSLTGPLMRELRPSIKPLLPAGFHKTALPDSCGRILRMAQDG